MEIRESELPAERVSDGLGPMERWERDRDEDVTRSVILQRVADGERLKVICKSRGWPYAVVAQWVAENEEFAAAYERALMIAADDLAQETVAISDEQALAYSKQGVAFDPDVPRDALRVKARQWVASKLHRDRFGDRQDVKHSGVVGLSLMSVLATLPRASAEREQERDVTPAPELAAPKQHEMI